MRQRGRNEKTGTSGDRRLSTRNSTRVYDRSQDEPRFERDARPPRQPPLSVPLPPRTAPGFPLLRKNLRPNPQIAHLKQLPRQWNLARDKNENDSILVRPKQDWLNLLYLKDSFPSKICWQQVLFQLNSVWGNGRGFPWTCRSRGSTQPCDSCPVDPGNVCWARLSHAP